MAADSRFIPKSAAEVASQGSEHGIAARFPSLEAYLAHLREGAPLGKSWYREVRPGYYVLEGAAPARPGDRLYSVRELSARYGFSR